jgi:hypothetical protein
MMLQPSDVRVIAEECSELIPVVVSNNPDLTFDAEIWRLPGYIQSQVFDVLERLQFSKEAWGKVVGAMFIAATYISVRRAVEAAGSAAMKGALRWLDDPVSKEYLPPDAWREALARPAEDLLIANDNLSADALTLCAWCVAPDTARATLSTGRRDVQRLAAQAVNEISAPLRTLAAFLMVTLGLRSTGETALNLLVRGFFAVHQILASGRYNSEAWWLISPELPYLGWWRDWDRCEKLRQAVRDWLTTNASSKNPLLDAATNEEERGLARRVFIVEESQQEFLD